MLEQGRVATITYHSVNTTVVPAALKEWSDACWSVASETHRTQQEIAVQRLEQQSTFAIPDTACCPTVYLLALHLQYVFTQQVPAPPGCGSSPPFQPLLTCHFLHLRVTTAPPMSFVDTPIWGKKSHECYKCGLCSQLNAITSSQLKPVHFNVGSVLFIVYSLHTL